MTQKQFNARIGRTLRKAVHEQIEHLQRKLARLSALARGDAELVKVERSGYVIKRVRVKPTTYYRVVPS